MSIVTSIISLLSTAGAAGSTALPISSVFADPFNGTALSGYTVYNAAYQTITVAGGDCRIVGASSVKNVGLAINRTGYGKSTLRNYTMEVGFKLNNIGSTTFGVMLGVTSQRNIDQNCSTYALFDYSTTSGNTLQIVGGDSSLNIGVTSASSGSGLPAVNTTDLYKLSLDMAEDVVTATLTNLSAGGTKTVSFTYDFTTPYAGNHVKPNIFYYAFGVNGTSDVTFQYFNVGTTERRNVAAVFLGDSITTGYYGGSAGGSYAYKLRAYTTGILQVMAGGYNRSQDVVDNIGEVLAIQPTYAFLMIGTNDIGNSIAVSTIMSNIAAVKTQLDSISCEMIPLLVPNGGSPLTSGTLNYSIKNTYSNYIDTYTTGWATMSTANGEMVDAVHPTATGMTKLANIIKAARPTLFPL